MHRPHVSEEDLALLREALEQDLPAEASPALARLRAALKTEDPADAVADLVNELAGEGTRDLLGELTRYAGKAAPVVASLSRQLGDLKGWTQAAERHRESLKDVVEGLGGATLRRTLSGFSDAPAMRQLEQLVGEAEAVGVETARLLEQVAQDPRKLDPAAAHRLAKRVKALEDRSPPSPEAAFEELLPVLADLRSWAEEHEPDALPRLRLMEAAIVEITGKAAGRPPERVEPLWAHTLDVAEKQGDLDVARRAAARLQAAAVDAQDHERVRSLAHRVRILARELGDVDRELLARCEEALALLAAGRANQAHDLALRTLDRADEEERAGVLPRAHLTLGQVLERQDLYKEARRAYEAALAAPGIGPSEEARASLGLATCLAVLAPHDSRRKDLLERARDLGLEHNDPRLMIPATLGLASLHLDAGERRQALEALALGSGHAEAHGGKSATAPFRQILAHLAREWGEDTLLAELEGLRKRASR